MHAHRTHLPGGSSRVRTLVTILILGAGLSLILYLHGAWWWYAPLAALAIVPAHLVILGAVAFLLVRRGHVSKRHRSGHGGHSDHGKSMLLHEPRQFDVLANVITLGQERKLRQWTLDLADLQPGNAILDVGCGTGTLLLAAAERVGPSGTLHGVEPSTEMAAYARRKAEAAHVAVEITERSAESLPHAPASFDVVFCTLVFHHLPRSMREPAIREMFRVLRPGGRAVIVDWQQPRSFMKAMISPMFLTYLLHNLRPSGSPLDEPSVERIMQESGFEDVARCSFGSGGAVGAVVGRIGLEAAAGDRPEARDARQAGSRA